MLKWSQFLTAGVERTQNYFQINGISRLRNNIDFFSETPGINGTLTNISLVERATDKIWTQVEIITEL